MCFGARNAIYVHGAESVSTKPLYATIKKDLTPFRVKVATEA